MTLENLTATFGFGLQILVIMALVWGLIGLRIFFFFRRLHRHRQEEQRHRAEGTFAGPGFFVGRQLPAHYDMLASVGTGGPAPTIIGDRILRPAIGVRLFVLCLALAIVGFAVKPDFAPKGFTEALRELPVDLQVTQFMLIAAATWGAVYIFGFEARYNADQLIVTRLFKRREYRWKNLLWLKDDGGYDLVLTFAQGGKAKVLKHSVGIAEFRTFAEQMAKRNRGINA